MAEDPNPVDIHTQAELHRSDSTRRYVSTTLPTGSLSIDTIQDTHQSNPLSYNEQTNVLAKAVNIDLSNYLENMHCANEQLPQNAKKTRVRAIADATLSTVRQQDSPDALRLASKKSFDIASLPSTSNQKDSLRPEKRKRNSPQTRNVREKLLQYAYKDRRTKNVTFALQADEEAVNQTDMEEDPAPSRSSSAASVTRTYATRTSSDTDLLGPLIDRQRQGPHTLHITEVQTTPTEDQMRNYTVPDRQAKIWRLYEFQLRQVGRAQARINQLHQDVENGTPPSWCYGLSQAPQFMRPYHRELVKLSAKYAIQMAITAKSILMNQAEADAAEARHLQETLFRMYKEAKDPNFELATGRAEGIAAHYTRKEQALNLRLAEEDQSIIPADHSEWADHLSRRKVAKPNPRSHSRSNSRERKNQPKKAGKANPPKPKAGRNNQKTQGPQPPKRRHLQQQGQQQQQQQTNQQSRPGPSYIGVLSSASNTSNGPRPSSSATFTPSAQSASNHARSGQTQGYSNTRPTHLNAEEQRLIALLRESKK